ncbi:hypothetical protein GCM10018780_21880 [Streptomyces lanatus]|nr:hypothetical protein GCM10018780_21880 [Streptomyces lanatus]
MLGGDCAVGLMAPSDWAGPFVCLPVRVIEAVALGAGVPVVLRAAPPDPLSALKGPRPQTPDGLGREERPGFDGGPVSGKRVCVTV